MNVKEFSSAHVRLLEMRKAAEISSLHELQDGQGLEARHHGSHARGWTKQKPG